MNNREYLAKREEEYIKNRIKDDKVREKELEKLYKQAVKEVQNKIFEFYGRYFGNNSSSLEEVNKMISATEKEGLENIKNNISRLELLEYQLNTMLDDLTNKTKDFMLKEFQQAVIDEAERQTGAVALNKQDIDEIINSSFKAGDFSDNIWGNKEALLESIKQGLIRSFALGEHPDKVAMDVAKKMNSNLNSAKRIMRTEVGLVQIAQQKKNYEDYDVQYYQNIREPGACEHCKALAEDSVNIDSAPIFKVSEMQRGVNAPLFHPNCRCSTIPVTDEVAENSQLTDLPISDFKQLAPPRVKEEWNNFDEDLTNFIISKITPERVRELIDLSRKKSDGNTDYDNPYMRQMYRIAHEKGFDALPVEVNALPDELTKLYRATSRIEEFAHGPLEYSARQSSSYGHGIYLGNGMTSMRAHLEPGMPLIEAGIKEGVKLAEAVTLGKAVRDTILGNPDLFSDAILPNGQVGFLNDKIYDMIALENGVEGLYAFSNKYVVMLNRGAIIYHVKNFEI